MLYVPSLFEPLASNGNALFTVAVSVGIEVPFTPKSVTVSKLATT